MTSALIPASELQMCLQAGPPLGHVQGVRCWGGILFLVKVEVLYADKNYLFGDQIITN